MSGRLRARRYLRLLLTLPLWLAAMWSVTGAGASVQSTLGDVWLSAGIAPRVLHSTGNRRFVFVAHIRNAGPALSVFLTVQGRPWPHAGRTSGEPLAFGRATLTPPASFGPVYSVPMPGPSPYACARGHPSDYNDSGRFDVRLPARSETTLTVAITGIVPPWPGTDYTPRVFWNLQTGNGFAPSAELALPHVSMRGPTGVHIRLRVQTRSSSTAGITIRGTTDPPTPHRIVSLSARPFGANGPRTPTRIAQLLTNAAGRFAVIGWKPHRPGTYQLSARIRHPGRGLLPDSGCGPTLVIDAHGRASTIP